MQLVLAEAADRNSIVWPLMSDRFLYYTPHDRHPTAWSIGSTTVTVRVGEKDASL